MAHYDQSVLLTAIFAEVPRLLSDEGLKLKIYLDTENKATFGYGTLITRAMPEWIMEVGDPVSEDRCLQAFWAEIVDKVMPDIRFVYPDYAHMPQEAVQVAINLLYQLGRVNYYTGEKAFHNHVAAMKRHDWQNAADELRDSHMWRVQAKKRTERRAVRLEGLVQH